MPIGLVQVAFRHDSGLPEDAAVNTFHFEATSISASAADVVSDIQDAFYKASFPERVDDYLSGLLTGTADVTVYNLADPQPRVPVLETTLSVDLTTGADLPEEVAFCLSYKAASASGSPPARRRGRIYLGPLNTAALNAATGRPDSDFMETVRECREGALLNLVDGAVIQSDRASLACTGEIAAYMALIRTYDAAVAQAALARDT